MKIHPSGKPSYFIAAWISTKILFHRSVSQRIAIALRNYRKALLLNRFVLSNLRFYEIITRKRKTKRWKRREFIHKLSRDFNSRKRELKFEKGKIRFLLFTNWMKKKKNRDSKIRYRGNFTIFFFFLISFY